jgi:murein DD-endopeptidase MepM/ murein hydrolase activator NlpD
MQKLIFILLCFVLFACNSIKTIKDTISNKPPYEQYIHSLEQAGLQNAVMTEEWIAAGKRVFHDSVIVALPFTESGYFPASEPGARSYQFEVKEGQVLTVEGEAVTDKNGRLFVDLFVLEGTQWEQLAHADSALSLTHEFRDDYTCLLRIQPELLAHAYYSIGIGLTPTLINPVSGASNRSIGSFYGADRDGGRRSHEGVDIFAPKGTPVIAPTDGYVNRVGTNNLGGKVVWMRDRERGHSYYFAHLDEQLVTSGTRVQQGDTLGLVGNTGNARTTPPHLHFGIYQRGSIDPIHYIRTFETMLQSPMDTTFQPEAYKVTAQKANLRSGPGTENAVLSQLEKDTWVQIIARNSDWYRIALPDQTQGYLHRSLLSPVEGGPAQEVEGTKALLSESRPDAVPLTYIQNSTSVEVLARYENYRYVKTPQGQLGWIVW